MWKAIKVEHFWKIAIILLIALFAVQLINSRRVYDVTVYTYRIVKSYYRDDDLRKNDPSSAAVRREQHHSVDGGNSLGSTTNGSTPAVDSNFGGNLNVVMDNYSTTSLPAAQPQDETTTTSTVDLKDVAVANTTDSIVQNIAKIGLQLAPSPQKKLLKLQQQRKEKPIIPANEEKATQPQGQQQQAPQAAHYVDTTTTTTTAAPATPLPPPEPFIFQGFSEPLKGGEWSPPSNGTAAGHLALIIPFRDRQGHLRQFLPYMHGFLQKQQLHYRIFLVEQNDTASFNRAKLMNVGFVEASKRDSGYRSGSDKGYTCFVFHDVDLLPLDNRIKYNCSKNGPMHLAAAMDKFGFNMPYGGFFGGACAFTPDQLKKMNGFSNKFFGWGGEDDDISARVRNSGQTAQRYPIHIAKYHMIRHGSDKGNEANPKRFDLLKHESNKWASDGLNSLSYNVLSSEDNPLYTKISVQVDV